MDELPHNSKDPKIVLGYDNQIKLMVNQTNEEKWTKSDFEQLEKCKLQYLEEKIGYSIVKLNDIISHDGYEWKEGTRKLNKLLDSKENK